MTDLQQFWIAHLERAKLTCQGFSLVTGIPADKILAILDGTLSDPEFTISQMKNLSLAMRVDLFNMPSGVPSIKDASDASVQTRVRPKAKI